MALLVACGLFVVGVLLICLDLSQRVSRQSPFYRASRRSRWSNSIAYSTQSDFFRKMPTLNQHAHLWYSRKQDSVEGLHTIRRSLRNKSASSHRSENSLQPVNPLFEKRPIDPSQRTNASFENTSLRRRFSSVSGHPELSSPRSTNPAFEKTIKPFRPSKQIRKYTDSNSSKSLNAAFEKTIKPFRATRKDTEQSGTFQQQLHSDQMQPYADDVQTRKSSFRQDQPTHEHSESSLSRG